MFRIITMRVMSIYLIMSEPSFAESRYRVCEFCGATAVRRIHKSIWEESPSLDIKVELYERSSCAVRQGNSSNSSLFY